MGRKNAALFSILYCYSTEAVRYKEELEDDIYRECVLHYFPIWQGLCQPRQLYLTLSPTAPCAPPCPTALGLIGPRKKE